jgi:hypothetical protein
MTPADWDHLGDAVRILATPLLVLVGWWIRQLMAVSREINAHLVVQNGRLLVLETWKGIHEEHYTSRFEKVGIQLDRIEHVVRRERR